MNSRLSLLAAALAAVALGSFVACDDEEPSGGGGSGGSAVGGSGGTSAGGAGGSGGGGGAPGPKADYPVGPWLQGDCDPLVPSHCGFPLPSNVWVRRDETTPTGVRLAFTSGALPVRRGGGATAPDVFNVHDGFSTGLQVMTDLPGATAEGLPTPDTIEASLGADSPTILLDAATGARIPHFAEIDVSVSSNEGDRAFWLRPVVRLGDATRYVVAIRRVKGADGLALPATPAFAALRDGTPFEDPSIEARRELYADLFGKLAAAGIGKEDLQLAWDFTTSSRDNNTRWLVHMRDDALATVGAQGPAYRVTEVEENPNEHLRRRIHVKMMVPIYTDVPGPGGRLVFGADGLPRQNGEAEYDVLVLIPNKVVNEAPGFPLQNGHGLLGDRFEGRNGYLARLCDKHGWVGFSTDLVGFAEEDYATVVGAISGDIGAFEQIVERQHQGMLNQLLAMRLLRGRFVNDENVQFGGHSVIDPAEGYYRGDSQGGIMGTTYLALSTDVTRGLIGEPGMPYSLLLNRSRDFEPFFQLLMAQYSTGRDIQHALALVQQLWDRTEPNGWSPYITSNPLPNTPVKQVLLHVALGDQQVTPLGAHLIARSVGAKLVTPKARAIFGLEEAAPPFTGSGIVEFDFGLPAAPLQNIPPAQPEDQDPHDWVRVLDAAYDQTNEFLRTGTIRHFCDGVCDPE